VTQAGFRGRAGVVPGTTPATGVLAYRVSVGEGRLRMVVDATDSKVLDVPLDRVTVRPLGRAGATIVEIDASPILVDFTRREQAGRSGPATGALRVVRGPSGRWSRRRFRTAIDRDAR
jgi:hypothetical protein